MLFLGKYNDLIIERETSVGLFLSDGMGEEVLLPNKYVTTEMRPGERVRVFVYNDSEDRPVATTLKPKAARNEFAFLRAKETNRFGAFLDWGLEKDLFVPFAEQPAKMSAGEHYLVYLYLDHSSQRLLASARYHKFLDNERLSINEGDKVNLMVAERTDLGFNVIINHFHKGLLYYNEVFRKISVGDSLEGYIKQIRPGNKVDVSLEQPGPAAIEPSAQRILEKLRQRNGALPLADHSPPDEIQSELEMSKKLFKKAIGSLYKQGLILIEDGWIKLREV